MMTCTECFDNHLRAELLSETCHVDAMDERKPNHDCIRLVFTCVHEQVRRHLSYAGSADWPFALAHLKAAISNRTTEAA